MARKRKSGAQGSQRRRANHSERRRHHRSAHAPAPDGGGTEAQRGAASSAAHASDAVEASSAAEQRQDRPHADEAAKRRAETGGGGGGAAEGRETREERRRAVASTLRRRFAADLQSLEEADAAAPAPLRLRNAYQWVRDADGKAYLQRAGMFTEARRTQQLADLRAVMEGKKTMAPGDAYVLGLDDTFSPGHDRMNREAADALFGDGVIPVDRLQRIKVNMFGVEAHRYFSEDGVHEYTDFHSAAVEPRLVHRLAGEGPGDMSVPASMWTGRTDDEHALLYDEVRQFIDYKILQDCGPLDECEEGTFQFLSNAYVETKEKEDGTRKHRMVFSDVYGNLFIMRGLPAKILPLSDMLKRAPVRARVGVVDGSKFFCSFALGPRTQRCVAFVFRHAKTRRFHVAKALGMLFGEAYGPSVAQDLTGAESMYLEHYNIFSGAVVDDLAAGATAAYIEMIGDVERAHANVGYALLALPAVLGITDAEGKSRATPRTVAIYRGLRINFVTRRVEALPQKLRRVMARIDQATRRSARDGTLALGETEKWLSTTLALSEAVVGMRMFAASWLHAAAKVTRANDLEAVKTLGTGEAGEASIFVPTAEAERRRKARARWRMPVTGEMRKDAAQLRDRLVEALAATGAGATREPGLPFQHEHHLTVRIDGTLEERKVRFADFDASMSHWGAVIYIAGQEPVRSKVTPRDMTPAGLMRLRTAGKAQHLGGDFLDRFTEQQLKDLLVRQAEAMAVVAAFEQALLDPAFRKAAAGARFIAGEDNTNWIWMWLKGGGGDPIMRDLAKRLWAILAELGSTIEFRYVESLLNPADDPTRPSPVGEGHLGAIYFEAVAQWAHAVGGRQLTLDACASHGTAQTLPGSAEALPHISRFPEGHGARAERANVLRQHFGGEFAYIYPPAVIAEQVLAHAQWCGGQFVAMLQRTAEGNYLGRHAQESIELARFVANTPRRYTRVIARAGEAYLTIPSGAHGDWMAHTPSTDLIAIYVPASTEDES